ncbi:carboxypeptidase B [Plutella xylostella]|uniref:carboxypeptidase B n=1 Tax=Plutella xylostella TaxID=51655 RepID=UPI002032E0F5|nr:carboxypeptidase B [Plutella xylostella]
MIINMFRVFTAFLFISVVYAKHEIYDGASVYEVQVENKAQSKVVSTLEEQLGLDIWSRPGPSRSGMVLVPKNSKEEFAYKLRLAGIKFQTSVDNVKEQLEIEDRLLAAASDKISYDRSNKAALPLNRVYRWQEVENHMVQLAQTYPDKVTLVNGGPTYEGRPVNYLRVSTTNFQDLSKPVVFIMSLLHSREWITQAATLYALDQLLVNNTESDLINDIDWIIMPTANPDGYIFSHDSDRFWRKNRKYGRRCMGVDLNRNYDINWGTESSDSPCYEDYHGTEPFSEPESVVTKKILEEHQDRIQLFLDIHSYGSYVLYGYGNGELPPNGEALSSVGVLIGDAIDAAKLINNPNYTVGNLAQTLYPASGGSQDYALSVGVPYSYCLELPAFRGSSSITGFLVDPEFIEQAGYETWEGIKAGARYALNNYRMRKEIQITV